MGIQPRALTIANQTVLAYRCEAGNNASLAFNIANDTGTDAQVSMLAISRLQAGVWTYEVTAKGDSYTAIPAVTVAAPSKGGEAATAEARMELDTLTLVDGGAGYVAGNTYNLGGLGTIFGGVGSIPSITVTDVDGSGVIQAFTINNRGVFGTSINTTSNAGIESGGTPASFTATFRLNSIIPLTQGFGYITNPDVTIAGNATGTASINSSNVTDSFKIVPTMTVEAGSLFKTDIIHMAEGDAIFVMSDTANLVATPWGIVSSAV